MNKCNKPPLGWSCTRLSGHTGPCAAIVNEIGRRLYYQDLIYKICNLIDPLFNSATIVGTVERPSLELLDRIKQLRQKCTL